MLLLELSVKTDCFVIYSFIHCVQSHQEEHLCDCCGSESGFHHPKENPVTRLEYLTEWSTYTNLGRIWFSKTSSMFKNKKQSFFFQSYGWVLWGKGDKRPCDTLFSLTLLLTRRWSYGTYGGGSISVPSTIEKHWHYQWHLALNGKCC